MFPPDKIKIFIWKSKLSFMKSLKILDVVLIVLGIVFLVLQSFGEVIFAMAVRCLAFTVLALVYTKRAKRNKLLFIGFILLFVLGDVFYLFNSIVGNQYLFKYVYLDYLVNNIIYLLAYTCLIIKISLSLNFAHIVKQFSLYLTLILGIAIFFIYSLSEITRDFVSQSEFNFENFYNIVVICLMCVALINYLYHDDRKSINMLIGSIFIAFSEILQLAYFYLTDFVILNITFSLFFILGILFFYLQSISEHREQVEYSYKI